MKREHRKSIRKFTNMITYSERMYDTQSNISMSCRISQGKHHTFYHQSEATFTAAQAFLILSTKLRKRVKFECTELSVFNCCNGQDNYMNVSVQQNERKSNAKQICKIASQKPSRAKTN